MLSSIKLREIDLLEKKPHYIDKKELYEALVEHKRLKEQVADVRVSNYIGSAILLITEKLASRGNFSNYSYKDEMISDAIENCLAAVDNYDPDKFDNPFGYFTRIAWYAFIRRIDREKKQNYLKYKNYRRHMAAEELSNVGSGYQQMFVITDEIVDSVIRDYEDSLKKRKEIKRSKEEGIDKFVPKEK